MSLEEGFLDDGLRILGELSAQQKALHESCNKFPPDEREKMIRINEELDRYYGRKER